MTDIGPNHARADRPVTAQDLDNEMETIARGQPASGEAAILPQDYRDRLVVEDRLYRARNGTFFRPLPFPASGNIRFVFVGGPMHYVDRRGEHSSNTATAADFQENVARIAAIVDSSVWIDAAVQLSDHLVRIAQRKERAAYGLAVGFVNSYFRDAVKAAQGRDPEKMATGSPIDKPSRGRWLYGSYPAGFVFGCVRAHSAIEVVRPPEVAIWRWPDRSDLMLHAMCATVSARGHTCVTLILPDVPTLRSFAQRYNRCEKMDRIRRTLLEQLIYFSLDKPHKRGNVVYGRFQPTLVIDPDGTQWDGELLRLAVNYLDTHYDLRTTAWDLARDQLFMQRLVVDEPALLSQREEAAPWTAREVAELGKMRAWYRPEHDHPEFAEVLFSDHPLPDQEAKQPPSGTQQTRPTMAIGTGGMAGSDTVARWDRLSRGGWRDWRLRARRDLYKSSASVAL